MRGFTLLELLIVIGILAVLATVIILVLNPAELLRQGRDTQRISDLANINKTLSFLQADQPDAQFGTASTTYLSLPDTDDANPPDCDEYSLPSLPSGWSYYCALKSNYRKTDSTGWVPVNLTTLFSTGSPLSNLPIDPVNQATNSLYYTYTVGGSWELNAMMEAQKNKLGGASDQVSKDGGDSYELYELGSNLSTSPINDSGLVGYWKFDEGTGTVVNDSSGYGNNGTASSTTSLAWASGKIGPTLDFNASPDFANGTFVQVPHNPILEPVSQFTVAAWIYSRVYPQAFGGGAPIVAWKGDPRATYELQAYGGNIRSNLGAWDQLTDTLYTNRWVQAALTYNNNIGNGSLSFYIDGGLRESKSNISPPSYGGSYDLLIGKPGGIGPVYFNGLIDDVRIYNRALSAAEIKVIYNATK